MSIATAGGAAGHEPAPAVAARPADEWMRRVLFIRPGTPPRRSRDVHRIFSTSILLSALRCLLTYVLLPVLTPVLGVAAGVGPAVGLPLAVVALVFDVMGIRRFWVANHRHRWAVTALYVAVMALVMVLLVIDVRDLAH